jgi:hypothetical protein
MNINPPSVPPPDPLPDNAAPESPSSGPVKEPLPGGQAAE